ncbi:hypothetical protein [Acinetobacter lwoffii]|uniref:hypothetical protein n=1 Tax=Acinetobacter lwoffii TaxID=28090 RepID=UPI003F9138AD
MANTDIKWFSFDNTNAPQLTNTWGCLIDVLDACLVSGYGSQPVLEVVIESGVATATFGGAHNFKQFQVIDVSGADQSVLNGEFKILGLTVNTIEFLVDAPNQISTGTISCKVAPLGWTKAFSGSQKAIYQAKNKESNPYFLRVDNSRDPVYNENYAKFAKVGILDSCEHIDDLTGNQSPYDPLNPNKNWVGTGSGSTAINGWFKWQYAVHENSAGQTNWLESEGATNGARKWVLVGDESNFFLINHATVNNFLAIPYGFCCVKHGENTIPYLFATNRYMAANSNNLCETPLGKAELKSVASLYSHNGLIDNTRFSSITPGMKSNISNISSGVIGNAFKVNGSYLLSPFYALDADNYLVGELPLIYFCPTNASTLPDRTQFNIADNYFLSCRYKTTAGGEIGSLFLRIHEGGLL